jgi:hypothetical protein
MLSIFFYGWWWFALKTQAWIGWDLLVRVAVLGWAYHLATADASVLLLVCQLLTLSLLSDTSLGAALSRTWNLLKIWTQRRHSCNSNLIDWFHNLTLLELFGYAARLDGHSLSFENFERLALVLAWLTVLSTWGCGDLSGACKLHWSFLVFFWRLRRFTSTFINVTWSHWAWDHAVKKLDIRNCGLSVVEHVMRVWFDVNL